MTASQSAPNPQPVGGNDRKAAARRYRQAYAAIAKGSWLLAHGDESLITSPYCIEVKDWTVSVLWRTWSVGSDGVRRSVIGNGRKPAGGEPVWHWHHDESPYTDPDYDDGLWAVLSQWTHDGDIDFFTDAVEGKPPAVPIELGPYLAALDEYFDAPESSDDPDHPGRVQMWDQEDTPPGEPVWVSPVVHEAGGES